LGYRCYWYTIVYLQRPRASIDARTISCVK